MAAEAAKVDEETRRLLAGAVACPGPNCGLSLQKRDNQCNHIVCGKCKTHVCALCGADITDDVTAHFMIREGPCNGMMWEATGAPVDDDVPAVHEDTSDDEPVAHEDAGIDTSDDDDSAHEDAGIDTSDDDDSAHENAGAGDDLS